MTRVKYDRLWRGRRIGFYFLRLHDHHGSYIAGFNFPLIGCVCIRHFAEGKYES